MTTGWEHLHSPQSSCPSGKRSDFSRPADFYEIGLFAGQDINGVRYCQNNLARPLVYIATSRNVGLIKVEQNTGILFSLDFGPCVGFHLYCYIMQKSSGGIMYPY